MSEFGTDCRFCLGCEEASGWALCSLEKHCAVEFEKT